MRHLHRLSLVALLLCLSPLAIAADVLAPAVSPSPLQDALFRFFVEKGVPLIFSVLSAGALTVRRSRTS